MLRLRNESKLKIKPKSSPKSHHLSPVAVKLGLKPLQSLGRETVLWMGKGWLLWHCGPVEFNRSSGPVDQSWATPGKVQDYKWYRLECGFREICISSSTQGFEPSLTAKEAIYWDTCVIQIAGNKGEEGVEQPAQLGYTICVCTVDQGELLHSAFCTPLGLGDPTMKDRNSQPWEKKSQRESDRCL